jgi:cytoskeletal protein CcmA (bactofilin family)
MRLGARTFAILAAVLLTGGAVASVGTRAGDVVSLRGSHGDLVFAAGETVNLSLRATDDVAAAGETLRAEGAAFDHVFLAGQTISFASSTAEDIFAAGREIAISSGEVTDDVVAAGERVSLATEARVGGDVVAAGRVVQIDAPVGGDVRASGAQVTIDSAVTGNVNVNGRTIVIGPNARIGGALTHRGRSVTISPQAQITGQVTALRPRAAPDMRPLAGMAMWAAALVLFGFLLVAIVIAVLFPRLMNETSEAIRTRPFSMLGLGLGIAIVTPFLIILLLVTLLGIPLAFVLGAAFALLWPVAIVSAVYAASMLARTRMRTGAPAPSAGARALWVGVAMIVFIVLTSIPILGFLVCLIAYLLGLGAVTIQAGRALSKPAAA